MRWTRPARCRSRRIWPLRRAASRGRSADPFRGTPPTRGRSRVLAVRVVVVPPLVRRRLRDARPLGRVLPLLLASERRDVEIAPGGADVLVAAVVDEVGSEDPVALADE